MKYRVLQKKILVEGAVALAALALAGGLNLWVGSLTSSKEHERTNIDSQVRAVQTQQVNLNKQFEKAKNSLELYKKIRENSARDNFTLNRNEAYDRVNELKKRHRLSNLNMSISPVEEITSEPFKRKNAVVVSAKVTMKFEGMSDRHLFSFMNSMKHEFPGYVKYLKVSIKRLNHLTSGALADISQGKTPALASAEVSFRWLGLKYLNAEETPESAPGQAATDKAPQEAPNAP